MTVSLYGFHAVNACLQQSPKNILQLFILDGRNDKRMTALVEKANAAHIPLQICSRKTLDDMSDTSPHQGIVAQCKDHVTYNENDLPDILEQLTEPAFLLILDGVQDPHNLGACMRSANAAGVHAVIAPKDKAVALTPTARKVACGAAEMTPFIQVTNLARTMRSLQDQGIWLYGMAAETDKTIFTSDISGPVAMVLGSEGKGLRQLTQKHCDGLLNIPMHGTVSSLNVSVATAICLFEVVRQRSVSC